MERQLSLRPSDVAVAIRLAHAPANGLRLDPCRARSLRFPLFASALDQRASAMLRADLLEPQINGPRWAQFWAQSVCVGLL